jgi:hypothetical protein
LSEDKAVTIGWVSLSKSGKSLSVKVLDQIFFVPLSDLFQVLNREIDRADLKQWIERNERPFE